MKTGFLKKGLLGVAFAVALLMSLMPLAAFADDGSGEPAGGSKYTFALTGYSWGERSNGIHVMQGDTNCFTGIFDDEDIMGAWTSDQYLNANKQYYLSARISIDPVEDADISEEDVALTLDGTLLNAKSITVADNARALIAVFELPELEATPVLIPFTKIIEQAGSLAPGEGSFELEVSNLEKETNSPIGNFVVDGSFLTEGAGSMERYLSIENDDPAKVLSLLFDGILVSEKDLGAEGWTYDDAVWYVALNVPEVNSLADGSQDASNAIESYLKYLVFYKGTLTDGEFVPEDDQTPADAMVFENVYTADAPVVPVEPAEPAEPAAPATLAKTGDSTNAGLLVAMLFVSGFVAAGAAYGAKRKLAK